MSLKHLGEPEISGAVTREQKSAIGGREGRPVSQGLIIKAEEEGA